MEEKIKALGQYFAAILTKEYLNTIPRDSFHYIRPAPHRRLGQFAYLTCLHAAILLILQTNAAPAAYYLGVYWLTAALLTARCWHKSGYSIPLYLVAHLLTHLLLRSFLM